MEEEREGGKGTITKDKNEQEWTRMEMKFWKNLFLRNVPEITKHKSWKMFWKSGKHRTRKTGF